ncbi:hypothetical protein [Metabacillus malikii]|uniref:Uncharacterized protein n=1 Tax=Metabacillus malikii TaxID=1504265 RepID=A0ABT9ZK53_9BACI|nr:hypothetical protein [Metabacillus malikii]MDQ0232676.1 hypothetical protein [Metabacillus malikii]
MMKNLPLLIAILLLGQVTLLITITTEIPEIVELILLISSVIFNAWGIIALILYIGIKMKQGDGSSAS